MESIRDTMSMPAEQEMMRMVLQMMDEAEVLLDTTMKDCWRITICTTVMWSVEHLSWWDHSVEKVIWTLYMTLIQKQV
jgi:hypothetical protein